MVVKKFGGNNARAWSSGISSKTGLTAAVLLERTMIGPNVYLAVANKTNSNNSQTDQYIFILVV